MATAEVYRFDMIPGASRTLGLRATNIATGAAETLPGATVEATLTAGTYSAALSATWDAVDELWEVTIGAPHSVACAGRQAKLRVFATPAASVETTAIEATINVKA